MSDATRARITLHNAVQIIASTANYLADPKPDDSHRSLGWDDAFLAFCGVRLPEDFFIRVRTVEFLAEVVAGHSTVLGSVELEGKPLLKSLRILQSYMPVPEDRRSFGFAQFDANLPDPKLISNPLKLPSIEARTTLAIQYLQTYQILIDLCDTEPEASSIRTWPHHFDMATILPGGHEGATVGVGLSPGDQNYAGPYWYVTPSPLKPDATAIAPPTPWRWHTDEGFTGLVLPMSEVAGDNTLVQQTLKKCIMIARA